LICAGKCDAAQDIERRMIIEKDRMKKEFESKMEVSPVATRANLM
jgi:hypothetical protein